MNPTTAQPAETGRFDIRSTDGASIAVWADGEGPPLVMVHGGLNDHTTDRPFIDELRGSVTTFAMDRRGRGASGDGPDYSIEREFEDVAAVVDAVAARTGQAVSVWGHSYGADCAMGAATLTANVARLVLYEPGLGYAGSDKVTAALAAVETAIAAGDLEGALFTTLRDIIELTEEEIAVVRATPGWSARLAAVPRLPREVRAEIEWSYQPGQFDRVKAPTLVLAGAESPASQQEATQRAAAAIPDARVRTLDGHSHIAHRVDPAMVAAIVCEFVVS
ncbi:MAG TPA: alpha/beta hydrolase [Acidimicrobiia bacterium]|nr:alpha/beta hydrolase [Acidimicrobiia bacterium]